MSRLSGRLLSDDAMGHPLAAYDLEPGDVVAGTPAASAAELDRLGGVGIGLWELTEGTVRDTEVDEVFVVLRGDGDVTWEDGSLVRLGPGVVVRLRAGERTTWTIRATVRKVYVAVD